MGVSKNVLKTFFVAVKICFDVLGMKKLWEKPKLKIT